MEARELQDAPLTATVQDGQVVLSGGIIADSEAWSAVAVDDRRILLVTDDARTGGKDAPTGFASCPAQVFRDFLVGLHHARFTGMVTVDTGFGMKRVYFNKGDIVFAGSNIMDDRLGEVIYREARISLDELTNSAAQVTKTKKFGQVLISSGIFTNVQLWQALKAQVRQILRSLFMVDKVYFEMHAGTLPPTEVIFDEPAAMLLGECYSYGTAFQAFLGRLRSDSEVVLLVPREEAHKAHPPSTFAGDLLELIEQQANVQELLNASKLIDNYTIAALYSLTNHGYCKVAPDTDDGARSAPALAPLKSEVDAYSYVLQAVRRAFAEAKREFPVADARAFAASLNPDGFPSVFVDPDATLSKGCVSGMMNQCLANVDRVEYFTVRIEAMIQFLLQVAGDNLEFKVASKIRADYRSVTA